METKIKKDSQFSIGLVDDIKSRLVADVLGQSESSRVIDKRQIQKSCEHPGVILQTGGFLPNDLSRMGAKGRFPLRLGTIHADILGGPYMQKPKGFYGIKMAEEISRDCVISIPTRDFDVPDRGRLFAGLYAGISLAQQGVPLWVGCMGGIGRTGLYFGALSKVMSGYQKLTKHKPIDPITYVRSTYYSHAVETEQQVQWVTDLDVSAVVDWVAHLQGYRPPWYRRVFR